MTLYLIGCGKRKRSERCRACDMYTGPLFRAAWRYAAAMGPVLILSAKHGLLHPDTMIEPYDQTIRTDADSRRLADQAVPEILALKPERVVILASERYSRHIRLALEAAGVQVEEPLRGRTQGQRLHWFAKQKGVLV